MKAPCRSARPSRSHEMVSTTRRGDAASQRSRRGEGQVQGRGSDRRDGVASCFSSSQCCHPSSNASGGELLLPADDEICGWTRGWSRRRSRRRRTRGWSRRRSRRRRTRGWTRRRSRRRRTRGWTRLDVGVDVVGPVDGLDVGPDVVGLAVGRAVDIRAALVVDASGRKQRRGGKKNSNTNESGNVCGCKSEHASVSGSLVRVEVSRAICRANTTPSVSMAALGSS